MRKWALELKKLSKSFGSLKANDGIDLQVQRGTIHAIVGENGAGKSTAMKMLFGMIHPDSGSIWIDGIERQWKSPRDAIAAGLGMVHQHFMLAETETALENVLLETPPDQALWRWLPQALRPLARDQALNRLRSLASKYKLEVNWSRPVYELPVGVQQRIEILKLLYQEASILILDEPTAVLTPQETEQLFSYLKLLASEGRTILIITHKLKEVMSLAKRVSVFRAGKIVGNREVNETSPEELASLMVGRKVGLTANEPPPVQLGPAMLEVKNLSLTFQGEVDLLSALSFRVRGGEIVGIAGVEGNGQSELLRLLIEPASQSKKLRGSLKYFDQDAMSWRSSQVRASGVGIIPEDRLTEGLLLNLNLRENFFLGLQDEPGFKKNSGFINFRQLEKAASQALEEYDVRPRELDTRAGRLSGGNQQKLIIAREFERNPRFLIAAQPTRGVDVGAIEAIHARIIRARTEGAGVLLVSSELDEILSLSDRILVMYRGAIVAEFSRDEARMDQDQQRLGLFMGTGRA